MCAAKGTHRHVCIKVVLPVEQWLPVDGTVESKACQYSSLHTSSIQHLRKRSSKTFNSIYKCREITIVLIYIESKKIKLFLMLWFNLLTGSVPGNEASKCETSEFGGAKNLTWDPEKSFDVDWIWAWISSPTTPTIWGRLENVAQEMKSWWELVTLYSYFNTLGIKIQLYNALNISSSIPLKYEFIWRYLFI